MTDNPTPPTSDNPNYIDWTDRDIEALLRVDAAVIADARADALRSDPELAAMLEAEDLPKNG